MAVMHFSLICKPQGKVRKEIEMTTIRFVVDPSNDRVHLLAVDEDNPSVDVTVCGESPNNIEGEWAELVQDRAGFYPVPVANICMKCFPNLKQFQEEDVPLVVLDV
jgi:hypothetical protein